MSKQLADQKSPPASGAATSKESTSTSSSSWCCNKPQTLAGIEATQRLNYTPMSNAAASATNINTTTIAATATAASRTEATTMCNATRNRARSRASCNERDEREHSCDGIIGSRENFTMRSGGLSLGVGGGGGGSTSGIGGGGDENASLTARDELLGTNRRCSAGSTITGNDEFSSINVAPRRESLNYEDTSPSAASFAKSLRSLRYPSGSAAAGATTRKCVLTLDGYSYVIVASTPENLSKRDEPAGIGGGGGSSGTTISGAATYSGHATATHPGADSTFNERLKANSPPGSAAGPLNSPNATDTGRETTTADGNAASIQNAASINGQVARHGSLTIVRRSNSRKSFTQTGDPQQTSAASTPSACSTNAVTFPTQPSVIQATASSSSSSSTGTQYLTTPVLDEHSSINTAITSISTTAAAAATASTSSATISPYENRSIEALKALDNNNAQAFSSQETQQQQQQKLSTIGSKIASTDIKSASTTASHPSTNMQPTSPNATNFIPATSGLSSSSNDSLPDASSSAIPSSFDLATENLPAVDTPDACDKAALRLRHLLRLLNSGDVSSEVLRKNLHYAARVLEAVFLDESKESKKNLCRTSSIDEKDPAESGNCSKARCNTSCKNLDCSQHSHDRQSYKSNTSECTEATTTTTTTRASEATVATNQDNNNTNSNCNLEHNEIESTAVASNNQTSSLTQETNPPCGDGHTEPRDGESVASDNFADDLSIDETTKSIESSASNVTVTEKTSTTTTTAAAVSSASTENVNNSSSSSNKATIQRQRRLRTPVWARSMSSNKTRLADEDDELSEVQPDAVPPEVREWLASTFTRQLATTRRRTDEKPKFRSVAHAIRAGIFVDRIYRRVSSTALMQFPPEVVKVLKTLDDWSFDVFALADAANGQPVKYIGYDLLNRYGIIHKFKIAPATLETFLHRIEEGYCRFRNPYHNNLHAADVTQTVHHMLCQTGLMNWLTDLEIYATLLAALIHDYEHTGTTNNFHVMSGSDTALLYNDRAVLENHHVSAAFRLLKDDDCNILSNLSREEFRELRTLIIDMVLSTDMSFHFQQLKNMKNLLTLNEATVDKSKALALVLHCCDISHPAKRWNLHHRWTMLLLEEFFRQGDLERELGLPFSPLCDRNNTLVAESQIGFIDFIVDPSMSVMADMLEYVLLPIAPMCKNVNASMDIADSAIEGPGGSANRGGSIVNPCTTIQESGEDCSNSPPKCVATDESGKHKFTIRKPWILFLTENKKIWKEQAVKDAEARAAAAALEEAKSKENEGDDV